EFYDADGLAGAIELGRKVVQMGDLDRGERSGGGGVMPQRSAGGFAVSVLVRAKAKVGPGLGPVVQAEHSLDQGVNILRYGDGPGAAAETRVADGIVLEGRAEGCLHGRGGPGEAQFALGDAGLEHRQAVAVGEILQAGDI